MFFYAVHLDKHTNDKQIHFIEIIEFLKNMRARWQSHKIQMLALEGDNCQSSGIEKTDGC